MRQNMDQKNYEYGHFSRSAFNSFQSYVPFRYPLKTLEVLWHFQGGIEMENRPDMD